MCASIPLSLHQLALSQQRAVADLAAMRTAFAAKCAVIDELHQERDGAAKQMLECQGNLDRTRKELEVTAKQLETMRIAASTAENQLALAVAACEVWTLPVKHQLWRVDPN